MCQCQSNSIEVNINNFRQGNNSYRVIYNRMSRVMSSLLKQIFVMSAFDY